jgi:hypothetical protein
MDENLCSFNSRFFLLETSDQRIWVEKAKHDFLEISKVTSERKRFNQQCFVFIISMTNELLNYSFFKVTFCVLLFIVFKCRRYLNWMFQHKVTISLAIQNLQRLQAINFLTFKSEILKVNRNHIHHIPKISFQNDESILLVQTLYVISIFEKRLNSFSFKPKNTSGLELIR